MSNSIKSFINHLAENPDLAQDFRDNPHAAVADFDLNHDERTFIANANAERLRAAAGVNRGDLPKFVV